MHKIWIDVRMNEWKGGHVCNSFYSCLVLLQPAGHVWFTVMGHKVLLLFFSPWWGQVSWKTGQKKSTCNTLFPSLRFWNIRMPPTHGEHSLFPIMLFISSPLAGRPLPGRLLKPCRDRPMGHMHSEDERILRKRRQAHWLISALVWEVGLVTGNHHVGPVLSKEQKTSALCTPGTVACVDRLFAIRDAKIKFFI